MNKFKTLKRFGNALNIIAILIVIIAILIFFIPKFGIGGGNGVGSGSGRSETGRKPTVVESKDGSKLYLDWNNPDDFNEIEGRINNNLNSKTRTLIIRTQKIKITTAKKEKIEELMKNKGSEAELKFEQLK